MWPFDQQPHCATIASKSVVQRIQPILHVTYDEDDHGWQFLDNESEEMEALCIVGLAHILEIDPSMAELAHLAPGWQATRASVDSPWVIEPTPPEPHDDED